MGIFVVLHEVRPIGELRSLQRCLAQCVPSFGRKLNEFHQGALECLAHLVERDALPLQDTDARFPARALRVDPAAESCAVGRHSGNSESHRFEGRITPGLVERREHP